MVLFKINNKRSGKRGVSPAISTVIMTGAMVAILAVTLAFANNFLWTRVAEGDFNSSKQLMQTVGLQIDDVAWTSGRTETVTYGSQYGNVLFQSSALNYTISVERDGFAEAYNVTAETGALMFVFPTSSYSITNDYFENIFPDQMTSLVFNGTSAPVARVFAVEKLPMADGNYIRVVVMPSVRVLTSSITTSSTTHYIRLYLPVLSAGQSPRLTQSVTLTGKSLDTRTLQDVTGITVAASFEDGSIIDFAFDQFTFGSEESLSIPSGEVILELYLSEVSVGIGVN